MVTPNHAQMVLADTTLHRHQSILTTRQRLHPTAAATVLTSLSRVMVIRRYIIIIIPESSHKAAAVARTAMTPSAVT